MCPTLTVGSFFRRIRSTFCSFVQQRQTSTTSNLNNSNLKSASKTKRRNKTDVENLEITLRIPHCSKISFLIFLGNFFKSLKGSPLIFLHLRQASVMGKCGCFFFRATTLISRGNSHVSRVRGLVVRCLLFNPEVSCSNPWVCANFFTSIPKQKVLTFFGTMRLFGFVRLFFGFVRLFFEIF